MISDESFVVLNDQTVALPQLKLMVRTGRFNLEMNGVQEVSATFDPLLKPDRLWMRASNSPYYIEPDRGGPRPPIPFLSEEAKTVCEFGFSGRLFGSTYIYGNAYDARLASSSAHSLSSMFNDENEQAAFTALHLILGAIGKLRDWPVPIALQDQVETLQICVGRSFAAKVEAETGLFFPPAGLEECILSEFDYEPD